MGALISVSKCCISDDTEIEVDQVQYDEPISDAKSTFFGHSQSDGSLSRSVFQKEYSST